MIVTKKNILHFFAGPALFSLVMSMASCTADVELPAPVEAELEMLPAKLDYNFHIKPILSDRCFKCHGPDKAKIEAGLQLTSAETAESVLESGSRAIVPGRIDKSEMVRRILSADPEERMPPPESHLTLSEKEKAMLIRWIDEGAEFRPHWSLQQIAKPDVPKAGKNLFSRLGLTSDAETEWVSNDIDRFVLDKMKEHGLSPSVAAEKHTLLRRVSMDLTGLPPTPEEAKAFLSDETPEAYEKAVDRLLASPHFGEHQAAAWLDLARYADTHGYQDDGMRNVYPYRDWVIRAFNQNLPFDQFVTWQLAGDLMPKPTRDMLIATSFNRQHPQSQEGGIVPEEYHSEYVADRTNTFGKAFLGLTMECARCHDHKYDPISAKDYYSLSAFFNQNKDFGEVPYNGEAAPTIMLPDDEAEKKITFIREKLGRTTIDGNPAGFDSFMKEQSGKTDSEIMNRDLLVRLDFEQYQKDQFPNPASRVEAMPSGDWDRRPEIIDGKFGKAIRLQGDCGVQLIAPEDKTAKETKDRYYKGLNLERHQPFTVSFWLNVLSDNAIGPVITKNNGEFEGFRGYDIELNKDRTLSVRMMYVYPANGIEFRTREKIAARTWTHVTLTYDGSGKAAGLKLFVDGKAAPCELITDNLTKSILHGEHQTNWSFMPFEIGKNFRSTIEDIGIDEFRFYRRKLTPLEVEALSKNESTVALSGDRDKLKEFYQWNYDAKFKAGFDSLSLLRLKETQLVTNVPELMIMQELPEKQQRETFILARGVYDSPTDKVFAETPERLGLLSSSAPRNRLGLAQWLLSEENPLFARVIVNRMWLSLFGNGLVKTQEDFGNQGDLPTHPELLDWLASTFREDGWNTRAFLKRIVMSSTYRQSSVATAEQLEADPSNKWLSRGPSHPFSAEQVRDNALATSGLLVRKIGGPSVYPYQPSGIWEALATRNAVTYEQGKGDDLYRRSLYTVWKRSSPPPMMLNFDAADRQLCTVRRQRTATPLQALVTMNDPQFVEAARVLAQRTITTHKSDQERIEHIFLSVISRPPRPAEMKIVSELLEKERGHFRSAPADARKLSSAGEFARDEKLEAQEVAAFTVVTNTIMNMDEALVKR